MTTGPPSTAAGYHRATCYNRQGMTPHALDWGSQPALVKTYPKRSRVPLDRDFKLPEIDYFKQACLPQAIDSRPFVPLDLRQISTALHWTHAVTARSMHAGQPFYYRSAASAGALYPFELYLVAHRTGGLNPGLYHYDPFNFSLTVLRRGSLPGIPPTDPATAATFYISGIFFRSAWKYRSRAYRYVLLDAGHLLENLRLALGALNHSFRIHLDFDDALAAELLGLDPEREACLACVNLHAEANNGHPSTTADGLQPLGTDVFQASQVSDREVAYPEIIGVHRAGNAIRQPVDGFPSPDITQRQPEAWFDLDSPEPPVAADYTRVLWQRRSRRNFIPVCVSREDFMTFMGVLIRSMGPSAGMPAACRSALAAGILVGRNMPVPPGFYLLDSKNKRLGGIVAGPLMEAMAAACLNQMWLKHAGLHLLLLTDPELLDRNWGARGYRYAMIEAGRLGQQAYLSATALGWGACGIGAIYDREAAQILDLASNGALLYLIGAGPVKTR